MPSPRRSFLKRSLPFAVGSAWPMLSGTTRAESARPQLPLSIQLDETDPSRSRGIIQFPESHRNRTFPVGYGKHGIKPEGESFEGGWSLAGKFTVNAILARDRFAMTDKLIAESGRTRSWLAERLFANMSSIDFDGDGEGDEYGNAFIGLEPESSAPQPFHFGEYQGVFRWYTYAIHGTQDPDRIGKQITGGCLNVGEEDLQILAENLSLGDRVTVIAV